MSPICSHRSQNGQNPVEAEHWRAAEGTGIHLAVVAGPDPLEIEQSLSVEIVRTWCQQVPSRVCWRVQQQGLVQSSRGYWSSLSMNSTLDMLQITLDCQWGGTGQAAHSEMKVG